MQEEELKTQKNSEKKPLLKKKRVIIAIIISVIGFIAGLNSYIHAVTYVSTDDAFTVGHNIQISSRVSGNIIKVYIDDNNKIKKGQLLVELDPADYEVRYEQALARLQAAVEKQKGAAVNIKLTSITSNASAEQANSEVGGAVAGTDVANRQISFAKANLSLANSEIESVKADLNLAQADFERNQKLYKTGAVSKQALDKTSANYKSLKAKMDSALEKAAGAESMLQSAYSGKEIAFKSLNKAMGKLKGANTVPEQISISNLQNKTATAEIKQLQAAAKQAKLELSYTKVYAPCDGVITGKSAEAGTYIQTGQPLFAIVPQERWVIANFKETQLAGMKPGQTVYIKIDSYPDKIFKGRVDSVQASTGSASSLFPPENAVGSFVKVVQRIPVKIVFTEKIDPKYIIVPGMSVIPEVKIK